MVIVFTHKVKFNICTYPELLSTKNVKNIYIYDPLEGFLYQMNISNINKDKFQNIIRNYV